jgi:hypothetical protein
LGEPVVWSPPSGVRPERVEAVEGRSPVVGRGGAFLDDHRL